MNNPQTVWFWDLEETCIASFYSNCTTVLIDDCVPNLMIRDHDNNLTIELIDVTRDMRNICRNETVELIFS